MPLTILAELECKQGNHMKAIQKYSEILTISRTAYGNSHIEVAKVFYLMALSLF